MKRKIIQVDTHLGLFREIQLLLFFGVVGTAYIIDEKMIPEG